jgi:hypothetical protein
MNQTLTFGASLLKVCVHRTIDTLNLVRLSPVSYVDRRE